MDRATVNVRPHTDVDPGLSKNIALLYLVQIANFVLPLVTLPYLIRVLGASGYGLLAFASALITYFAVLADFGFNITATRAAAAARNDTRKLGALLAGVTLIKLALTATAALLLFIVLITSERLSRDAAVYIGSAIALLAGALFPGWLLQGLEDMRRLVTATLLGRLISVALIFMWVRGPEDTALAAALQAAPLLPALTFVAKPVMRSAPPRHWRIDLSALRSLFRESRDAFLSTAATSLYSNSVVFVLGLLAPAAVVGVFSAASKIVWAAGTALWMPVSQAVYPRLAALLSNRQTSTAEKLLNHILRIVLPVAAGLTVALWLCAEPLGRIALGPEAHGAVPVLRILASIPALLILSNFFGVLVLYAHGQFAMVFRLQMAVAAASVAWLIPLILLHGAEGAAWSVLLTELFITAGFMYLCRTRGIFLWTRIFSS